MPHVGSLWSLIAVSMARQQDARVCSGAEPLNRYTYLIKSWRIGLPEHSGKLLWGSALRFAWMLLLLLDSHLQDLQLEISG